jgi:hypothetical protein
MILIEAIKILSDLGFHMGADDKNVTSWGQMEAEPFDIGKDHVVTEPYPNVIIGGPCRNVFIGQAVNGWYVTSHIRFSCRRYRCRRIELREIKNIFGGGKTLEEAVNNFVHNFKTKTYNEP